MVKKSVAVPGVETSLARRQEIEGRIQGINAQLGNIGSLNLMGTASGEALSKARNYLQYHGNGREGNLPDNKKGEYARLAKDAEDKRSSYMTAKYKDDALRTELAELQGEFKNISSQAAAEDVLRYQAKVDEIVYQISEYKRVIALEEIKVAEGNVDSRLLVSLHLKHSDLMADQALGKAVEQSSIDEIKAKISEEDARISQAKAVASSAEVIIGGLKRKINDAEQIFAPMKRDLQTIYCDYLISEAEKTGDEFSALANKLWEKHLRLLALGSMIEKQPDSKGIPIATHHCMKFKIPSFNLESCQGTDIQSPWLVGTDTGYPDITAAVDSVKRDVGALGITCL